MLITLEPTFYLRNHPLYYSPYDTLMITSIESPIKLSIPDEDFTIREVGFLHAYRLNLSFPPDLLLTYADMLSDSVSNVADYFLGEGQSSCFPENVVSSAQQIIYIEDFYVEPQYRGRNIGLKSLALFLQMLGQGAIVAGCPFPAGEEDSPGARRRQRLLIDYWSKLGLLCHCQKRNILWNDNWQLPKWLEECLWHEI
ncbi:unknown protein (plasmid) [Synechocystis sp. PCC 6803]|uniref:N-acetyltransferase domain-containing protein n=1 Tax=Synechocystis sp. (strain ATCC 27184 / PCC 6803 / Kazusa) TaxID=1111708 RepID=Q6ZEE8_SYNY3|nr:MULTISPECIES: hypothetical protein [unclassified Synechocystis]AGF53604.1 hypothetical protein MYO_4480 [Synechocystis sp. PCC 6803]AVP91457.1 hypothetical protein C7I86_16935 [Synechocystis sp. IPPAS B-1465]MBD2618915.1 hypothetical protein [Synechocystis sp. FACHB-898]MBD2637406.1 hypothetical protein [Synechocystis sp. FACHB-908]MBD2661575.1 hypothetical protein [Synechocystis sp. FACHB-929]